MGGKRVPKDSPRIDAYGTIDELNLSSDWRACSTRKISTPVRRTSFWTRCSAKFRMSYSPWQRISHAA